MIFASPHTFLVECFLIKQVYLLGSVIWASWNYWNSVQILLGGIDLGFRLDVFAQPDIRYVIQVLLCACAHHGVMALFRGFGEQRCDLATLDLVVSSTSVGHCVPLPLFFSFHFHRPPSVSICFLFSLCRGPWYWTWLSDRNSGNSISKHTQKIIFPDHSIQIDTTFNFVLRQGLQGNVWIEVRKIIT